MIDDTLLHPEVISVEQSPKGSKKLVRYAGFTFTTFVIAGLTLVHAINVFHNPAPTDEEGTYVSQAWALLHLDKLAPYTYWYDHPPFGWMTIAFLRLITRPFGLSGPDAVATDRELFVGLFVIALIGIVGVCRRLDFSWVSITFTLVVFGLSPLAVNLQRLVELDNVAVVYMIFSIYFALDPARRLRSAIFSAAFLGFAVLSVETILLFAPVILFILWRRWPSETRSVSVSMFLTVATSIGLLYVIYAISKNELLPSPPAAPNPHVSLLGTAFWQLFQRPPSGHIYTPGTIANQLLDLWIRYDPIILVLIPAGALLGWFSRKIWPFAFALVVGSLMLLRNGYIPITYPVELFPFVALTIGGLADLIIKAARRVHLAVYGMVAVIVVAGTVTLSGWWLQQDKKILLPSVDQAQLAAEHWVAAHANRSLPIMVDDSMWVDVVHDGWQPNKVVWFYKINTDSAIEKRYPGGWRDMGYVVVTPVMRAEITLIPFLPTMEANSTIVASFGLGGGIVDVYRVHGTAGY